jgi:hypothetical protein
LATRLQPLEQSACVLSVIDRVSELQGGQFFSFRTTEQKRHSQLCRRRKPYLRSCKVDGSENRWDTLVQQVAEVVVNMLSGREVREKSFVGPQAGAWGSYDFLRVNEMHVTPLMRA